MFGNAPTIGFMESLNHNKNVNLKNESCLERLVAIRWEKDKDQIINGYKNGPQSTQHGVNAEYFHTAIKNSEEIRLARLEGRKPILVEKSPFVNGPDDLIQGKKILQMKYYRNTNGSLNGCIDHLEKYAESYGKNDNAFYIIPPEQLKQLIDIKQGGVPEGMSSYQANLLKEKIARFESAKGAAIEDAIQAGAITYEEAQLKNIELKTKEAEEVNKKKHEEEIERIEDSVKPSVLGAVKAAAAAAGLSAGLSGILYVYNDYYKNKKNIFDGDYTREDYQKLAGVMASSGAKAGASAALFYAVSSIVKQKVMAASFIVGMTKGIASLKLSYLRKEITLIEFTQLSLALTVNTVIESIGEAGVSLIISTVFAGIGSLGVTLPAIVTVTVGLVLSIIGGIAYTNLLAMCKDFVLFDYKAVMKTHQEFLDKVDNVFTHNVTRLKNEFSDLIANINVMDNVNADYVSRVEACNQLSEKYGTNKIDVNESVASLKARFLKK